MPDMDDKEPVPPTKRPDLGDLRGQNTTAAKITVDKLDRPLREDDRAR